MLTGVDLNLMLCKVKLSMWGDAVVWWLPLPPRGRRARFLYLDVWRLHFLPGSASVLAWDSGFPQCRDIHKDIGWLPTMNGLYTSLWVLVQAVVYLWMWPCDELPTCLGCDPVLAPSTAGIGSSTPCDPECWLKWWLQLDGWMFYCLSMIYQGYLTYPLSLKACFKVVLILLLR